MPGELARFRAGPAADGWKDDRPGGRDGTWARRRPDAWYGLRQ